MSLQMDFNPKFSPSDWLLVQRKEFYKERNSRWKSTYDSSFWDSDRYEGGPDAQQAPMALTDLLKLQRMGTLNPCYDAPPREQGVSSGAEGSGGAPRNGLKGQFSLPLGSLPKQEPTPERTPMAANVGLVARQTAAQSSSRGDALDILAQQTTRINQSATRLEPVRTWQGEAERYPAMRHATSDSLLAKVYTASASTGASPSTSWKDTMVVKSKPIGYGGLKQDKRACNFTLGTFVPNV